MRWVLGRLTSGLLSALLAFILVFSLLRFVPGDPAELLLGERAEPAELAALRRHLGLDLPWHRQLVRDLGRLLHGDLGISLVYRRPVRELVAERVGPTLALALAALSVALVLALPLGTLAGRRPGGGWDRWGRVLAVVGVSMPNFWLGPLLLLAFSVELGWFPLGGYTSLSALVLPAVTLGTALAAVTTRLLRASVARSVVAPYVHAARARGVVEPGLTLRHVLPPALLPVVTILGLQLGALLSGAVITETIFRWPGLGRLLIGAIAARDYPLVQGLVVVFTGGYVAVNTAVDLLYGLLDPRTRRRIRR